MVQVDWKNLKRKSLGLQYFDSSQCVFLFVFSHIILLNVVFCLFVFSHIFPISTLIAGSFCTCGGNWKEGYQILVTCF